MPANPSQYQLSNGNVTTTSFRAVNTTSGSKRSRPNHNNSNSATTTTTNGAAAVSASTSTFHVDPMYNRVGNTNGSRRDALAAPSPSSSSHPSLMYGPVAMTMSAYDRTSGSAGTASAGVADWPAPTQLEGPGMPVARKLYPPPPPPPPPQWQVAEEVVDPAMGDVEGEVEGDEELDNKRYCICDGVSYGEMIACDDSSCEKEWVRQTLALFASSRDCLRLHHFRGSFILGVSTWQRVPAGSGTAMRVKRKRTRRRVVGVERGEQTTLGGRGLLPTVLDYCSSSIGFLSFSFLLFHDIFYLNSE
jgi:hypothetical protein